MSDLASLLGLDSPEPSIPAGSVATSPLAPAPVPSVAGGDSSRITVRVAPGAGGGEMAYGSFEAANRFDDSLAMWSSPIKSADADILPDKELIDGRARDLLRNDAYIQGGANLHKDNIVGSHFLMNARPGTQYLRRATGDKTFDDKWEEDFQEEVEELWELYSDSPDCWIDAQRTNNLTGLTRLAVGVHVAAGEVLATAEFDRSRGGEFATEIQMIDLDRLSDPKDRMIMPEENIRGGVRYGGKGQPLSYFIRSEHPHDVKFSFALPEWKEIRQRKPWGRLQVLHLFEQVRPDQSRGVAELAAAMKASRIGHKVRDLNLQRLAAQGLYAAAITSDLPTDQVMAMLGGKTSEEAVAEAVTQYATGFLSAVNKYTGKARGLHVDGVKIPHLFPGTKLDLLSPSKDNISGSEFESSLLRYIAASLGVSYEQLSRDYTQTNYASARAAMAETWKFMQSRKKLIADRFASLIFRLWLEEAINNNRLFSLPERKAGLFYTGGTLNLAFDAVSRCDWIGASRGQIDELKETQAAIARIEAGISTAEDELARLGKDWRKVYRQLRREQMMRDTLGLVLVSGKNSVVAGVNSNDSEEERRAA